MALGTMGIQSSAGIVVLSISFLKNVVPELSDEGKKVLLIILYIKLMYLFYDLLSRFISVGFFIYLGSVLILNFLTNTPEYINILIIMNISFVYRYITVHVISKLTNWIANDDAIKY